MFADTLVNILFRSSPFGSWKRLMFELMKESLYDCVSISPDTSIMQLHRIARDILDAVIDRNLVTLRNLVPISKDFLSESKVNQMSALSKYMTPALIAFEDLNGMTILHCAASQKLPPSANSTSSLLVDEQEDLQIYEYLLEAYCDCAMTDNSLRTPLHCAAYSLNSFFIVVMTSPRNRYRSKAISALEMLDLKGYRPIDSLLYTMSISNWRLVVSSKQIETCLLSLLPGEVSDALWTHAGSSEERQLSESSVFYKAIVFGDYHIAQTVVKLAKKSVMESNFSIIQDTIVQCTKRKKERSAVLLLQEFGAELFAKKALHTFLNLCISIAIWTDSAALVQIFFKIYCESFPENAQEFTPSVDNSSFMYFAALKGNNAVIKAIISSGGSQSMWQILMSTRELGGNTTRYSVLSQYSLFDNARLVRYFQSASPLSLYCMFPSRVGTIQLLLKAMKNFHSPVSETEKDVGASGSSSNITAAFSGPVGACLLRNNYDDFFGMNCLELFLEKLKLEWVSRILQLKLRPTKRRQLICRNGSEQSPDSASTNVSDTIETLKTLLEILLHYLKDSNMSHFTADTFFPSQTKLPSTCNCSDAWMHDRHALQDRLQDSKKKLDDLYSIFWAYVVDISATGEVMSDNRSFTFEKLHQFIDIRNGTFISSVKVLYSSYQIWERLEKSIRGSFFYFNLRLLCARSFLADKNWIRIAFCLLLLIDSEAVKHIDTRNANEADAKLIWSSFTRIINNALKSAEGRNAFTNKLMAVSNPYPRFGSKHCSLNNLQATSKDSIWRKIEVLFNNEKFSIGNYGKGMSSSSLNKLGISNDPKGFTAMTSSYSRRNKVNDIMNLFSTYLRTFLTDCKLLDDVGLQPLPVMKPTVLSKRVLTYSDYFTICSELDTCCKIEYLLSLASHNNGCNSEHKTNYFSVLDHLFCPTASVTPADGSINKIQGFLRDFSILVRESETSGMMSSNSSPPEQRNKIPITSKHVSGKVFHSFQENAAADLEKPVSVLLKYNSYFGFDDELQYHLLLPLCALGLWRPAALVLSGISNSRNSKNSISPPSQPISVHGPEYSAMCFMYFNKGDQFTGKELLNTYENHLFNHIFRSADDVECKVFNHVHKTVESWFSIDLDDVAVLTPLHFAIRDRKDDFIESFFQIFDKFPISLQSLLQFATNIGAADMCPSIVRRSSAFQGSPLTMTPNYIRTFALINTFPDENNLRGLSYVQYKNLSRTVSTANYTALLFALKYTARSLVEFTYPYMIAQQPHSIQHSPTKVVEDLSKLLQLDGNSISMAELLAGSYFVATTLAPCPLLGGGLLATGHTIQHDFLLEAAIDTESKNLLETIFQPNSWSCRVFSLNFLGCSALYSALHGGMLIFADKILSNACTAASQATASSSSTESLQDIDEGDTSKRSSNLEMLSVHQSLQVIPEYFSTNKISQMIRERVEKDIREAEYKCKYTTAIRSGLADHFVYGVRPYAVESACDTLAVLLKQVEYLWKLISESSFLRLIQLSYLKGSSELDSIVRSRQILTLLGIPFSRLGKTDSSGGPNVSGKVSEVAGHPQTDDTTKETSLFTRLTPDRLRKMLPWTRCCQIKELLIGWVKNRTVNKVPNIEAPIFAYKVLDISFIEASASGTDIQSLMKQTDGGLFKNDPSYDYVNSLRSSQQSMDTLRAQSNASEAYGKLCDELKFEIRPSQSSTIYGSRVIATPAAVDSFIASIKMDPLILKDSLRLANLICDFARLLVVSRMLISITTPSQPLDSTAISLQVKRALHPLDVIDQNIVSAKERQKELEIYLDGNRINLQSSSYLLNDGVLSMGGVNSKLRMFDILRAEEVLLFFKLPSSISDRFQRYRALICDGLIALFQDLGFNDFADFICNFVRYDDSHKSSELVRETFMKTTEASVESKEGTLGLSPDHSHLTSRLVNRAAQIASDTKLQRTTQAKEILTLKSGITSMMEKLQNLRIADFLSDIYAKPAHQAASQDVPFTAMKNYSATLTSHFRMYGRHKMDISNEETKKIVDMFCNPSSLDLNIGLSSSVARNTSLKDADDSAQAVVMNRLAAKDEMLAQLSKAYKIGTVFFDFLGSILHLSSGSLQSFRSVYNYDISCFVALADNYNPLCALCRNTSNYVRKPNLESSSLPIHKREVHDVSINTYELQVRCCEKLLKLGALAHKADNFGRVPIALAALAGNYRLLECLLKSTSAEDLETMELFPTLLWHVLMESPCFGQDNYFETLSVVTSFEECAVLLLRYEFPSDAPVLKIGNGNNRNSSLTCRVNDCAMSCLELAVMKRLEKVVQAITNTVTNNSTASENFGGVEEAGSVSRKLLFEHEAKSIMTSNDGDNRWKAAYLQPQCSHLSAVHMSALCPDFDLRTIDGVYNHAALRSRVGSIEKVSVLLQRHTHFDAIVSRHAEVVVQQLSEPLRSTSERELQFLHWVKQLGDVRTGLFSAHLPGEDGKIDQDMVCLRFFRNWLISSRQLLQRHLKESNRRQSLVGQTCPVRRAAKIYIREVKEKVFNLEKKVGDEQIKLSPRKKKLHFTFDEDLAAPCSVDFVHFVLSSAANDEMCNLFLKRLFLSPEKLKVLLLIDIDEVLLWCKNTANDEDGRGRGPLQDRYPKLPLSIQRLQRIVLLACFYSRCSVVDIVYSSILRWSKIIPAVAVSSDTDSVQNSTSLNSNMSLMMQSTSVLDGSSEDKRDNSHSSLSETGSIFQYLSTPSSTSITSTSPTPVIPASHRLLFRLLFDCKSALELSYEEDGSSPVSEVAPMEVALRLHESQVVTRLLTLTVDPSGRPLSIPPPRGNNMMYAAVSVSISLAVEAIAKGKVTEECCVALLQRAVEENFAGLNGRASSTDSDYDSLRSFLLCQDHRVRDLVLVSGETLLHLCSRRGHLYLVRYLLELGASPMIADENGSTSLQCSVGAGHGEVTKVLFQRCPSRIKRALVVIAYILRKNMLRGHFRRRNAI
eukprot:gene29742-38882_t